MSLEDLDLTALDRSFQKASTHPEDPRQQVAYALKLLRIGRQLITAEDRDRDWAQACETWLVAVDQIAD